MKAGKVTMTDLISAASAVHKLARGPITATGIFAGYASVFNRPDGTGDVVRPGAFAASLERRGVAGIRMLFQHDPAQPLGRWLQIHEDAHGLFVRGKLSLDVQRSAELAGLLRDGAIDGLSIGFKTVRARRMRQTHRRHLLEIDLWEISLVTFPMLDCARVVAKAAPPHKGAITHNPATTVAGNLP